MGTVRLGGSLTVPPVRTLLWVDCTAGAVVGAAMLAASWWVAPRLGLPHGVLVFTALANLVYGAYSFSLARQPEAPKPLVRVLVAANLTWTVVCFVLSASFAGPGSGLGAAYLAIEGVIVGALAAVEGVALRQAVTSET